MNNHHIDSVFDSMMDDVRYIKIARFVRTINIK